MNQNLVIKNCAQVIHLIASQDFYETYVSCSFYFISSKNKFFQFFILFLFFSLRSSLHSSMELTTKKILFKNEINPTCVPFISIHCQSQKKSIYPHMRFCGNKIRKKKTTRQNQEHFLLPNVNLIWTCWECVSKVNNLRQMTARLLVVYLLKILLPWMPFCSDNTQNVEFESATCCIYSVWCDNNLYLYVYVCSTTTSRQKRSMKFLSILF